MRIFLENFFHVKIYSRAVATISRRFINVQSDMVEKYPSKCVSNHTFLNHLGLTSIRTQWKHIFSEREFYLVVWVETVDSLKWNVVNNSGLGFDSFSWNSGQVLWEALVGDGNWNELGE